MSKTPREVIAEALAGDAPWDQVLADAVRVESALNAAGFVIAPKEPTKDMIEAGNDTDHTIEAMSEYPNYLEQIANFYRVMIAAAPREPKP